MFRHSHSYAVNKSYALCCVTFDEVEGRVKGRPEVGRNVRQVKLRRPNERVKREEKEDGPKATAALRRRRVRRF